MSEPSADEIVDQAIDNLVKLDLVVLFATNPDTIENVAGLAIRLGCTPQVIQENLPALIRSGLIERHGDGDRAIFTYTRDPDLRQAVGQRFLARYSSREQRRELELQLLTKGKEDHGEA